MRALSLAKLEKSADRMEGDIAHAGLFLPSATAGRGSADIVRCGVETGCVRLNICLTLCAISPWE